MKRSSKTKRVFRLGGGEFERSGEKVQLTYKDGRATAVTVSAQSPSVEHARILFLNAVAKVEPAVIETLLTGPYRALPAASRRATLVQDWRHVEEVVELRPLRSSLKEWASRWHLEDNWCLELALQTICMWDLNPSSRGAFHSATGGKQLDTARLAPDLGSWNPTRESRAEFQANAKVQFELILDQYCDAVETQAIRAGLKRTREKRSFAHFYWLARFQVHGETPAHIWRFDPARHQGSRRAVEKAIKDLARLIELTLR